MARKIRGKKIDNAGELKGEVGISDYGNDLVENTLRNIGLDPKDRTVNIYDIDMAEFAKSLRTELAKKKLRK